MFPRDVILPVARQECVRQLVGEDRVVFLVDTLRFLYSLPTDHLKENAEFLCALAHSIEPSHGGLVRNIPVVFADGESSCPPSEVCDAVVRVLQIFPELTRDGVDQWLKHLLWIHPFTDGNERLAWMLRTWLLNQFAEPEPLPNFFSEAL